MTDTTNAPVAPAPSSVSLTSFPIITAALHALVVFGGAVLTTLNFGWATDLLGVGVSLAGTALSGIHVSTTSEAGKVLSTLSQGA